MSGIVGMIDFQIAILSILYIDWGLFLWELGYERAYAKKG